MSKVVIKAYPVNGGDCFLIQYKESNIIIDTGFKKTTNRLINDLELMAKQGKKIDLLIITHIDNDHIGGAITLLKSENIIDIDEIWYNGYLQVFDINDKLEKLDLAAEIKIKNIISTNAPVDNENDNVEVGFNEAQSLEELLFKKGKTINKAFNGKAICNNTQIVFKDTDIEFKFLTPTLNVLSELKKDWASILSWNDFYDEKRNIINMPKAFEFYYLNKKENSDSDYQMSSDTNNIIDIKELSQCEAGLDDSIINKSSISFILSIKDINLLFLGDSNPDCVSDELEKLLIDNPKCKKIQLMKVAHHGSKYNISNRLLSQINVKSFLISTNGSPIKDGQPSKPDIETIAKIIFNEPKSTLYMNYPQNCYNLDIFSAIESWNTNIDCCIEVILGTGIEPLVIELECGVK